MNNELTTARKRVRSRPELKDFEVHGAGRELHLQKAGESFARLIPENDDQWRIEVFRNQENWEILDFSGTLSECLDFLTDNPHYLFWNR